MGSRVSSALGIALRDLSISQRQQTAAEKRLILDVHHARARWDRYCLLLRRAGGKSEKWD